MASMVEKTPLFSPPHTKRRRLKTSVACATCRRRKVKCDGAPGSACSNCRKKDDLQNSCSYNDPVSVSKPETQRSVRRIRDHQVKSPSESPPSDKPKDEFVLAPKLVQNDFNTAVGEINAAVTTRLGPPSAERPNLIATTDVPFFGVELRDTHPDSSNQTAGTILPSREHADELLEMYWRYIHPLEPLVHKKGFLPMYQRFFSGKLPVTEQRIFLSTLNGIFALSTQVQESLQPEFREHTSETYFRRAWALLRPESLVWEPGTLETVQCLLLISRYLQCTNSNHRTWMVVGLAVRMAQSLGLDDIGYTTTKVILGDLDTRQQLWRCCVLLDRSLSWGCGRPSTASLSISVTATAPVQDDSLDGSPHYLIKTLELYEVANRFMVSRMPDCHALADGLGLPPLRTISDDFATIMELDQCLVKWERNLPPELNIDNLHDDAQRQANKIVYRQSVVLRLRFSHARIVLLRHMLAKYCSRDHSSELEYRGVQNGVLKDCAELCIEHAQQIISLIQKVYVPGEAFGITTWWNRIFYLHLSGTILIAGMLRADLFTFSVTQSWDTLMLLLRAHSHLSPSIHQCVATFQTLSSKITETQSPVSRQASHSDGMGPLDNYFHDVFQDVGMDADNSLFGIEDMAWLSNFER